MLTKKKEVDMVQIIRYAVVVACSVGVTLLGRKIFSKKKSKKSDK